MIRVVFDKACCHIDDNPVILEVGKRYKVETEEGATVVCLVPSRTDTQWWHDYAMKGDIEFIRGRLKFVGAKHSAPFPNAVVVFKGKNR